MLIFVLLFIDWLNYYDALLLYCCIIMYFCPTLSVKKPTVKGDEALLFINE